MFHTENSSILATVAASNSMMKNVTQTNYCNEG